MAVAHYVAFNTMMGCHQCYAMPCTVLDRRNCVEVHVDVCHARQRSNMVLADVHVSDHHCLPGTTFGRIELWHMQGQSCSHVHCAGGACCALAASLLSCFAAQALRRRGVGRMLLCCMCNAK